MRPSLCSLLRRTGAAVGLALSAVSCMVGIEDVVEAPSDAATGGGGAAGADASGATGGGGVDGGGAAGADGAADAEAEAPDCDPSSPQTCVIDGVCHKAGSVSETNECQLCDPNQSQKDWSPKPVDTPCGGSPDVCKNQDTCDGNGACVNKGLKGPTVVCRPAASACDVAESCTGSSPTCPADTLKAADTPCGTPGECEVQDSCDGAGTCVDKGFKPSTTVCRAAQGDCDVAESCTGASNDCPANGFQPSGASCNGVPSACEEQDTCDGSGTCLDKGLKPATSVCRPAANDCDLPETCTGTGKDCPGDAFKGANAPCGPTPDACEKQDLCNGSGTCVDAGSKASGTECRAAIDDCDVAEACTGTSNACPPDSKAPATTKCGDKICDRCDGAGACQPNSTSHEDCGVCQVCSAGACVNQTAGQDVRNDCPTLTCTSYVQGFTLNQCLKYATPSPENGSCNGAGACRTVAESCTGVGTASASCLSAGCNKACPAGGLATSYDTPGEICFEDGLQHACPAGFWCDLGGVCTDLAGSCPYLFTWTGTQHAFESDLYPASNLGLKNKTGYVKPSPQDYYVLAFAPEVKDGTIDLRLVEPKPEVNYLDQLELYAIDLPPSRKLFAEKLNSNDPWKPVDQALHTTSHKLSPPVSAVHVQTGADVSAKLAASDSDFVVLNQDRNAGFDYQTLELDLGDVAAAPQLKLVIDAQTAYPDTNEGRALSATFGARTKLEVQDAAGKWVLVPASVAVLPRSGGFRRAFVVDYTNIFPTGGRKVRLTWLFKTYVDSILIDTTLDESLVASLAPLSAAELRFIGRINQGLGELYEYEYSVTDSTPIPSVLWFSGDYTRYGGVVPLMTARDDKHVIWFMADEIAMTMLAPPPPPAGLVRHWVIHTIGYYKDSREGIQKTVEPLPFYAMSNYPYDPKVESYPTDADHAAYRSTWNTRTH